MLNGRKKALQRRPFPALRNTFLTFLFFAWIGWIYEVLVGLLETHMGFVNRGFLFGPYLPIYGLGGLILTALLSPVKKRRLHLGMLPVSPLLVFLGTMAITTLLELGGSYVMEGIMGKWLWDYSGYFLNFQGRIALWSSVKFGLGGVFILYVLHPLLERGLAGLKERTINILFAILAAAFMIDLCLRPFLGSNSLLR